MRSNKPQPKPLWHPSCEFITASCHLAWGTVILLVAAPRLGLGLSFAGLAAWAIAKEYVWDLLAEGDDLTGSTKDFAFYMLGGTLGWLLGMLP